jgi:hypothetical protein
MIKNYKVLTENIRKRINPDGFMLKKAFTDELSTLSYSDVLVYIRTAMKSVEPEYTQKSLNAGDQVKAHLSNGLSNVSFEYQGSVMTNTHIKGYSDIDLLTICDKFYTYDKYNTNKILENSELKRVYSSFSISRLEREEKVASYLGDDLSDLRSIRLTSERILSNIYINCDINNCKAIKIHNSNLNRYVDIVTANWYDDVTSIINDKGDYRGIQIYNKDDNKKEKADYPFLSIKRINERSRETNGRIKKMIRFLKNVKINSEHEIDISSFEINAICYAIDISLYRYSELSSLIEVIYNQLTNICTNQNYFNNLVSVDGREYVFRNNSSKLNQLKLLLNEVSGIYSELNQTHVLYG